MRAVDEKQEIKLLWTNLATRFSSFVSLFKISKIYNTIHVHTSLVLKGMHLCQLLYFLCNFHRSLSFGTDMDKPWI